MNSCSKCKKEQDISEFHKDKSRKNGLNRQCKTCTRGHRVSVESKARRSANQCRYRANNLEVCRKREKEGLKRRMKDPNSPEKLRRALRGRLRDALAEKSKSTSALALLGCTIDELKDHLSSNFKPGMSFSNHGDWHIDHILPCAYFDLSCPAQQLFCFHWTNLQPLWALENMSKGDRILI